MEMSFPEMSYPKNEKGIGWLLAGWAREKSFTVAPVGKPQIKQLESPYNSKSNRKSLPAFWIPR